MTKLVSVGPVRPNAVGRLDFWRCRSSDGSTPSKWMSSFLDGLVQNVNQLYTNP
ncbi:hypothetical protein [Kumtagia ephedrae]|uniref:hypothetical protein n=1 Tax=Kumtagia ephedrae TaxID=2116701 RepID=UPI0014034EB3|nr:hypothetical protein [Mesorhizobium ephedrae]